MGLSAAQARLLTITSRKSDCEFQSMRYSHEKIALSRSMSDVSAEYQRALEQTKLVFDYYGSGDQSTPVSYGLFMTPSQANGFLPILTTNAQNRIVLDSRFAAAARAAGIPEEGLSSLPSTTVRNKFLDALGANNIITETQANTYKVIPYSQTIGMGTQDLVVTNMKTVNFNDLLTMLGDYNVTLPSISAMPANVASDGADDAGGVYGANGKTLTLLDLYTNETNVRCVTPSNGADKGSDRYDTYDKAMWYLDGDNNEGGLITGTKNLIYTFSDALYGIFGNSLNTNLSEAIETAVANTLLLVENKGDGHIVQADYRCGTGTNDADDGASIYHQNSSQYYKNGSGFGFYADTWDENGIMSNYHDGSHCNRTDNCLKDLCDDYIGFVGLHNRSRWCRSGVGISYTNLFRAFLTNFASAYENAEYGGSSYSIKTAGANVTKNDNNYAKNVSGNRAVSSCSIIDSKFSVDVETAIGINSDEALLSGYWDALLNNLCAYGWTENNNVTNNEYLQEMYKSGRLFISTCTDDGYYYQTSYSTLSSVREITDEEAATKAEAKYNAEKQKINHKEQIIDMKMKNLDTEISSLSSEYETIKGLLSKNIERSFTRYKA